jgi:hypothetical protein
MVNATAQPTTRRTRQRNRPSRSEHLHQASDEGAHARWVGAQRVRTGWAKEPARGGWEPARWVGAQRVRTGWAKEPARWVGAQRVSATQERAEHRRGIGPKA